MSIIEMLSKEMEQEAETTRKMLSRVPNDKYDWKPHEKSMTIQRLATHIADIPSWVDMALTTDELDFANNSHQEPVITHTEQLLAYWRNALPKEKLHWPMPGKISWMNYGRCAMANRSIWYQPGAK
jgi:hypothetical protein